MQSTAEEVSFEWSHHRILSTDSKVRTTLHVSVYFEYGSERVYETTDSTSYHFFCKLYCKSSPSKRPALISTLLFAGSRIFVIFFFPNFDFGRSLEWNSLTNLLTPAPHSSNLLGIDKQEFPIETVPWHKLLFIRLHRSGKTGTSHHCYPHHEERIRREFKRILSCVILRDWKNNNCVIFSSLFWAIWLSSFNRKLKGVLSRRYCCVLVKIHQIVDKVPLLKYKITLATPRR